MGTRVHLHYNKLHCSRLNMYVYIPYHMYTAQAELVHVSSVRFKEGGRALAC